MTVEEKTWPLIVFEGMDGTGKSTLSKLVAARLDAQLFAFPSHDGEVGKLIRRAFSGEIKLSQESLAYLMVADGLDRAPVLAEASRKSVVVCDRHTLVSGWVYQTEVYTIDALLAIQQRGQFRAPDIIFILDVPEDVAERRMQERHERNPIYEKKDPVYIANIRRRYMAFQFMHDNALLIDGTQPLEELADTVVGVIGSIMKPVSDPDSQMWSPP